MEQDTQVEHAELIDAKRLIVIGYGIGEVNLELYVGSSRLQKLVSDHQYRTEATESSGQLVEHILTRKWLDKLRHEHTNYELILSSRLPSAGNSQEQAHAQIKEEVNNFVAETWKVFALAYCQKLEIAWFGHLAKQNEAIQNAAERFQKERLQREQKREAKILAAVQQQKENLPNTRYAFTRAEVMRVLPPAPLKTPMWGPIVRRELNVIQTYALCSKDMNFYMCAVVSDDCDWLNFNASGCLEFAVNYEKKQGNTIKILTVAKLNSKLGSNLCSGKSLGDIVSVGNTPMLIVSVGGGRFSDQINWDVQKELFKQRQAVIEEQHLFAEAERNRLKAEHVRLETVRLLAVAEDRRLLEEQKLRDQQTANQQQQEYAEEQARLRQARDLQSQAAGWDRSSFYISYPAAVLELETIRKYKDAGVSIDTIKARSTHLIKRCTARYDLIQSSKPSSDEGTKVGAVIGGILGLLGGAPGAMLGAAIGGAIGLGMSDDSGNKRLSEEKSQWLSLIAQIDDFINAC